MKKAFDQTVRDIKRGVNKKVLKVPGIEQKVLDATSNEPWGPHGSHLADIANASRNYQEYQMIMGVVWKRINDTGKNWRHVYKGLTVLEYLVANGSERVIDEIREHAYQISTLSEFQYIDSSGRDQGSNVRKKSQSLVLLVNDKDRIVEVRQKAAANRDKFRNTSATGGMHRPNSYSSFGGPYDDEGRYGGRDDERNSYGRDDERQGRYSDSNRDGDRYSRDSEERYGRDGYRDDSYHGRSRSVDKYNYGSRSRSSDRDREQAYDDDGNSSSRGGARVDENSVEGRKLGRTYSEQNIGAPPSYEEAVTDGQSPAKSERDGEPPVAAAPKPSSPPTSSSPVPATTVHITPSTPVEQSVDNFDEFDPRGSVSANMLSADPAPPAPSNNAEVDLLGSLSESYALALMPTVPETVTSIADLSNSNSAQSFAAATSPLNQSFEDPFGETPFRATPTTDAVPTQTHNFSSTQPFQPTMNQSFEQSQPVASQPDTVPNFGYGDNFSALSYTPTSVSNPQAGSAETQNFAPEMSTLNHETDILAGILPPSGPSPSVFPQTLPAPEQAAQHNTNAYATYHQEPVSTAPLMAAGGQPVNYNSGFFPQQGFTNVLASQTLQAPTGLLPRRNSDSFLQQTAASNMANQTPIERHSSGNFPPQYGATQYTPQTHGQAPLTSVSSQPSLSAAAGQLALVPQPTKEKFETKSTVWADTLSRGLVDLNISGDKINPLNNIGIDFDSLNRKEKRLEKPAATPVTSTITMGKAMGSGSGIGRAGAGAIRPAVNPAMGAGMGMGLGSGMGIGMGGGSGLGPGMNAPGYGGMNQHQMGMGMGMGMGRGMNMNMNMGMGQGVQMPQPNGLPPGTNMSGYNPMMGGGFAPQQQPYVGGYAPQQHQQQYGSGYR